MPRLALTGPVLAAGFLLAPLAQAQQFVVADATYTHSAQTTTDSHYKVEPTAETPADWTSPVDYATGSVHVRLEVKTKPSDAPTRFQICFEMKVNYNCTDQVKAYTAPGVYEWDTKVQGGYRPGPVDFSQGILRTALILKDTNNVKPAPENVGAETAALYLPSDLRVTVTVVAAGSVYEPPDTTPAGGSGGGGAGGAAGSAGTGGSDSAAGGVASSGGANAAGSSSATAGADASGSAGAAVGGSAPTMVASGGSPNQLGSGTTTTVDDASCAFRAPRSQGEQKGLILGLLGLAALRVTSSPGRSRKRSLALGRRRSCPNK